MPCNLSFDSFLADQSENFSGEYSIVRYNYEPRLLLMQHHVSDSLVVACLDYFYNYIAMRNFSFIAIPAHLSAPQHCRTLCSGCL